MSILNSFYKIKWKHSFNSTTFTTAIQTSKINYKKRKKEKDRKEIRQIFLQANIDNKVWYRRSPQNNQDQYKQITYQNQQVKKPYILAGKRLLPSIWTVNYSIIGLFGLTGLPLHNHNPCDYFQKQSNAPQYDEQDYVCWLPLLLWIQDFQSFEHIKYPQNYDRVPDSMMVNVPVEPVLVIFLWPQEQCKYLHVN